MGINDIIIYIVVGFLCIGAIDKCIGNKLGFGERFAEGFMTMGPLTLIEQLQKMVAVEKEVWQMPTIPIHQTFTAMNNGGIILGAFHHEELVGFLYSFPGYDGKKAYLCSHMLGILPQYRTVGLGVKMKYKQKELAKELGYSMITWTFDPLESKNAYINLYKLGAYGAFYHANHYGELNDQLNQGLPTDRIQVIWDVHLTSKKREFHFHKDNLLLRMDEKGLPLLFNTFDGTNNDNLFVQIPADFQSLKKTNITLAKRWRYETRKISQQFPALLQSHRPLIQTAK